MFFKKREEIDPNIIKLIYKNSRVSRYIEFIFGIYNSQKELIEPSDFSLYSGYTVLCFMKVDKMTIYSLPQIKDNKFYECIEFFKLYEKPLFGIHIFPQNKKCYLTLTFDFSKYINLNDNEHENDTIFDNDIITKEYIAKIGLSIPFYYTSDECPNFISGIKSKAGLDKYTISFEFTSSSSGNFIIGDELYNYNPKKYFESQYLNTYSNEEFELFFNDIMISDNINNQNISFNGTYTYLSFNLRVIIGSKEYKQEIDNTFFNKLVLENICQIDNITFNTSQSYYIYNYIQINQKCSKNIII